MTAVSSEEEQYGLFDDLFCVFQFNIVRVFIDSMLSELSYAF